MRRRSSGHRPASKRRTRPTSVREYIAQAPAPARSMLKKMRATIRSVVPAAATETISYRIPAFRHDGILVWYAAFADHCSLFPGGSVLKAFEDETTRFKTARGTIQFPLDEPLPTALIKKIVKARVAQQRTTRR